MGGFFLSVASSNFSLNSLELPGKRECNLNGISFITPFESWWNQPSTNLITWNPKNPRFLGENFNPKDFRKMAINFHPCLLKNASEKRRSRRWGACCCLQRGEKWWGVILFCHQFLISEQYPNPKFNMVHLKMGALEVRRFRIWKPSKF